jgi:hypothetical protein
MNSVRISSFKELSLELTRQLDGSSEAKVKEITRVEIETTGSIFGNIMPCSFPNPEQILSGVEEAAGRRWDNDISINGTRAAFIADALESAYL